MWWAETRRGAVAYLGDDTAVLIGVDGHAHVADERAAASLETQIDWLAHKLSTDARQARLVVADRWLRYVTVPWNSDLLQHRAALAYAREELEAAFSTSFEEWEIERLPGAFGEPQLVRAWPPALARLTTQAGLMSRSSALLAATRALAPWLAAGDVVHVSDGPTHAARFERHGMVEVLVYPRRHTATAPTLLAAGNRHWSVSLGRGWEVRPPETATRAPQPLGRDTLIAWMAGIA